MKKTVVRMRVLAAVLAVSAIILVLKNILSALPLLKPQPLMAFDDKDITRIALTGEHASQIILRKNNAWVVAVNGETFAADGEKVGSLLVALHGFTAENVVSRNKDKRKEFGIGTPKVVIQTPKKSETVYVGSSSVGDGAYIAFDSRDEVFNAPGAGTLYLDGDYRDLRLPFGNTEDVTGLEIRTKNETSSLTKEANAWRGDNGKPVSDIAVNAYLNNVTEQQAIDIIPRPVKAPEDMAELVVTLKSKNKTLTASFYPKDEQYLFLDIDGNANRYVVPKVYAATLEKTEADFMAPTGRP